MSERATQPTKQMSPGVRVLVLFVLPNVIFAGLAVATTSPALISLLNSALIALAIGVCVAYFPTVRDILMATRPIDTADLLAMGIFTSWAGSVVLRSWSITWRFLGQPEWLLNTDIVAYGLFLSMCAAVFHLAAPAAVGDRVPTMRWIWIGMLCAIGVGAVMLAGWALDIFNV